MPGFSDRPELPMTRYAPVGGARGGCMLANLIVFLVASAGGGIGWWLGSLVGFMTAFFVSLVGTAVGTYYGRRLTR